MTKEPTEVIGALLRPFYAAEYGEFRKNSG